MIVFVVDFYRVCDPVRDEAHESIPTYVTSESTADAMQSQSCTYSSQSVMTVSRVREPKTETIQSSTTCTTRSPQNVGAAGQPGLPKEPHNPDVTVTLICPKLLILTKLHQGWVAAVAHYTFRVHGSQSSPGFTMIHLLQAFYVITVV